jgi:glycosyltransferase involved in cell wall biosynthesis
MRILHVVASLSSEHGGPPVFVTQLAIAQHEQGHYVAILTASQSGCFDASHYSAVSDLASAGVRITSYKTSNLYRFSFGLFSALMKSIPSYDIIHVHSIYRFPVDFAMVFAAIKSKPILLSPHGSLDPYLHHKSGLGRLGLALKKLYHLVFSSFIKRTCLHFTTIEEQKLCAIYSSDHRSVVIPIGVPAPDRTYEYTGTIRSLIKAEPNDLIIGHVGRLHAKKNLVNLIKAFHKALEINKGLFLVFIGPKGDDQYMQMLHQESRAGLGQHRVFFLGEVPHQTIPDYLADIDIFCLPSFTENFGLALVEAMAASIPVVITKHVNIYQLVADGKAGIVTHTDGSSISKALILLSSATREARREMGSNGLRLVRKFFSPQVICDKYIAAYCQLAAESHVN